MPGNRPARFLEGGPAATPLPYSTRTRSAHRPPGGLRAIEQHGGEHLTPTPAVRKFTVARVLLSSPRTDAASNPSAGGRGRPIGKELAHERDQEHGEAGVEHTPRTGRPRFRDADRVDRNPARAELRTGGRRKDRLLRPHARSSLEATTVRVRLAGRRLGRSGLEVDLDIHIVADCEAAVIKRHIPPDAVVLAVQAQP